jgi:hypothetical protein
MTPTMNTLYPDIRRAATKRPATRVISVKKPCHFPSVFLRMWRAQLPKRQMVVTLVIGCPQVLYFKLL